MLQDTNALYSAGVLGTPSRPRRRDAAPSPRRSSATQFLAEGWTTIDEEEPSFGQASSAAGVFLEETGAFAAGEFQAVSVFDTGGARFPMIGDFDLFAFWHEPHYVVVEVAALEPTRTEPGRARPAVIDETRQRQYVYMIRNLGTRRQPAFVLSIGAGLIFFSLVLDPAPPGAVAHGEQRSRSRGMTECPGGAVSERVFERVTG